MGKAHAKKLSSEILREQKEVIQIDGLRIQVVEVNKIIEVFEKHGIRFHNPF